MARAKCTYHGTEAACIVCPHVLEAITKGAKLTSFVIKDDRYIVNAHVCSDCKAKVDAIRNTESYEAFVDTLQPACLKCFEEMNK